MILLPRMRVTSASSKRTMRFRSRSGVFGSCQSCGKSLARADNPGTLLFINDGTILAPLLFILFLCLGKCTQLFRSSPPPASLRRDGSRDPREGSGAEPCRLHSNRHRPAANTTNGSAGSTVVQHAGIERRRPLLSWK